jgi:CRISPR-associated protein Csb2
MIQSIIKNSSWNLADMLEKNYVCSGIYIPNHKTYSIVRYYPLTSSKVLKASKLTNDLKYGMKNSEKVVEHFHVLKEKDVYLYFKCVGQDKLEYLSKLHMTFHRLGKGDNVFYLEMVSSGKKPNVVINPISGANSSISVPYNTSKAMSFRYKNNLGNSCNISSEAGPRQKASCLDSNIVSTYWSHNYHIRTVKPSIEVANMDHNSAYKYMKKCLCEICDDPIITGHTDSGEPLSDDHTLIAPLSFSFGVNSHINTILLMFPNSLEKGHVDEFINLIPDENSDNDVAKTRDEDFYTSAHNLFLNYSPIIIPNPFDRRRSENRNIKKFKKLLSKSLRKNGVDVEFDVEFSKSSFGGLSEHNVCDEVINKYMENKIAIRSRSVYLRFHRPVSGPIVVGSAGYRGFGLFLPSGMR